MRRRSPAPAVTLFPFLAVLVCTMGALIFLLLITTRRIRHDQETSLAAIEEAVVPEEPDRDVALEPGPEPEPLEPDLPSATAAVSDETAPSPVVVEEPPVISETPSAPTLPDLRALRAAELEELAREWRAKVAMLQQKQQSLQKSRQRLQAQLQATKSRDPQSTADQVASQIQQNQTVQDELNAQLKQVQEESKKLLADLTRQQQVLDDQQRKKHEQLPEYRVVAYDGEKGMSRRPILVECRETELIFAAEKISLPATMLNGFDSHRNPLLAGTQALKEYWTQHDRATNPGEPEPYLLFIVRPGGTQAFYAARSLLEQLDEPFGYELVEAGKEIHWPEADPQAVAACQAAVDEALKLGPAPASARAPSLAHGSLQYSDRKGQFSLEEVQRLREPAQPSFHLDGHWSPGDRMQRAASGSGSFNDANRTANGPPFGRGRSPEPSGSPSLSAASAASRNATFPAGPPIPAAESIRFDNSSSFAAATRRQLTSPDDVFNTSYGSSGGALDGADMPSETATATNPQAGHPQPDHGESNSAELFTDSTGTEAPTNLPPNPQGLAQSDPFAEPTGSAAAESKADEQPPGSSPTNHPASGITAKTPAEQNPFTDTHSQRGSSQSGMTNSAPQRIELHPPDVFDDFLARGGRDAGSQPPSSDSESSQGGSSGSAGSGSSGTPASMSSSFVQDGRQNHRWGISSGGSIAIERSVTLHIYADRVQLADWGEVDLHGHSRRPVYQQGLAEQLDGYVRTWGNAPSGFYWKPTIHAVIHPGGNRHYAMLKPLLQQWNLARQVDYALD